MRKPVQKQQNMRKPKRELRAVRQLLLCLQENAAPAWLVREHYLLCGMCRYVMEGLAHCPAIPYVSNTKNQLVPYAFIVSETVVPHAQTEEMITALSHFHPDEAFLRSFPVMRAAAVLCRIAACCGEAESPQTYGAWLDQLRRAKEIDWNAVHDRLSSVEQILMRDPGGAYPLCDEETKAEYRAAVYRRAQKTGMSEEEAAQAVWESANTAQNDRERQISYCLFPCVSERRGLLLHLAFYCSAMLLSLGVVLCLHAEPLWTALCAGAALLLPFYTLVRECAGLIAAKYFAKYRIPVLRYRIAPGEIPDEGRTLTVTTALLRGGEHDRALVRNLERFYLRNRGENTYFGLLCDLPPADRETLPSDTDTVTAVREQIAALNRKYGDRFCLFVRRRVFCAGEECYMGWERKRGAVLMLARLLRGIGADAFLCIAAPAETLEGIRYVCTLDEDTVLPPDALCSMVGAMLHPHNRPQIRAGAVRCGCAILQPQMATTLEGASATRFTLLCTGRGGMDPYSRFHTDAESVLYGEGSFCGKGLFDVDAFLAVLDGAFPDHAVLSHDFLEGLRLGCRNFSAVTLSDALPTTPGSYFSRQSRWVRGDVQALRFAFSSHKNASGETVKNPVSVSARLRIIDHVLSALTPPAMLRAILVLAFLPFAHGVTAVLLMLLFFSYLIRPLGLCLRPWSWHTLRRQFFGAVYTDLRQSLYWLGFRITFLAQEGWVNTKAIAVALYRMTVSGRHLLTWVTAGEGERRLGQSTAAAVFRSMRVSVLIGAVLVLFSPHPSVKLLGLAWLCAPWIASGIGKPLQTRYVRRFSADFAKKKPEGVLTSEQIRDMAEPIWRFFADHVNEASHHLPPDNIQWFPINEKKIAMRTSPTNIGLYLCACISACLFGFIDERELWHRLESAYSTMSRLRRYRGHFYNWYDLHTCEVIGTPYLSTVDSGNLACALLCAASGAEALSKTEIRLARTAKKLRRLAQETDFSFLYHAKSGQLHLGYHTEGEALSAARYDLYASEIRSAVYFAIAMGQIPAAAWTHLGAPLTECRHMIGTLSWTGSAFEYFMPTLWLPTPENSHTAQMLAFAFEMQADDVLHLRGERGMTSVFGKSEGAYFGLDTERNFQYRPYGTQALALCDGMAESQLCMPYALYLMLPFAPATVGPVLDALPSLGMRGIYGLYESLDAAVSRVGGGYAVVRSYMAHHMGMSLAALTNAAFDGILQRYFLADARMEAYHILLSETVLADARPVLPPHREVPLPRSMEGGDFSPVMQTKPAADVSVCTVLSNTASYLLADTAGRMTLYHGTTALSPADWHLTSLIPLFTCYDAAGNTVYVPCAWSGQVQGDVQFQFCETPQSLVWCAVYSDGTECRLTAQVSVSGVGFLFEVSLVRYGEAVPFVLTASFRPVLYAPYAYAVHRTFADLFLQIWRDGRDNTVYLQRRPRSAQDSPLLMTVTCGGLDHFGASADASHLLPLGYTLDDRNRSVRGGLPARIGTRPHSAVSPYLCLRGRASGGRSTLVLRLGNDTPVFDPKLLSDIRTELQLLCGGKDSMRYVSAMLTAITGKTAAHLIRSAGRIRPVHAPHGKERLWKYGISGDLPYFCVTAGESESDMETVTVVLSSWKYLLLCGIRCDLVLCVEETDAYAEPVRRRLSEVIGALGLHFFLNAGASSGGVHFVSVRDAEADGIVLSAAAVFSATSPAQQTPPQAPQILAVPVPDHGTQYSFNDRRVVITKGKQTMPWSHILSNRVFSTLVTTNTLGFSFFENARECRVTPWYGDASSERCGEYLLLRYTGVRAYHDLCRSAQSAVFAPSSVHYLGLLPALSYRVSVSLPDRMRHKRIEVRLKNEGTEPLTLRLRYQLQPLLGVVPEDGEVVSWNEENRTLVFRTETNAACAAYTASLSLVGCEELTCGQAGEDMLYVGGCVRIPAGEEVLLTAHLRIVRQGERQPAADALIPPITWHTPVIRSGDAGLDALAATWLPWQTVTVRMFARCGFYQPGGAYGFRDQLQDAMAAAVFAPELLLAQLFRAASHQYQEGDVQHWWHPGPVSDRAKLHRGIRSRCSDDRLWLPLAAARYASLTGDTAFLQKTVRYLESPPLAEHEDERYETPLRSEVRESLYMHCVRAIECTLRVGFGIHGMPLIGIGDWNDGMNSVGAAGQGETVWGAMFLMLVLSEFLPLCAEMGDAEGVKSYAAVIRRLATAVEGEAWNGSWYRRAWYDDGTPMGNPGDAEAEIDLLPQAFAALVNYRVRLPGGGRPFDEERVHAAMLAAYERLFDENHGIFALLDPPFGSSGESAAPNPGYIAGYPPGARENGGQYTHAAVWGAMGLFAVGETERGMRVVHALSPLTHTADDAGMRRYQKEPWALCGDILRTPDRIGEGGWSLYTGSAGWYYRLLLALFGDGNG